MVSLGPLTNGAGGHHRPAVSVIIPSGIVSKGMVVARTGKRTRR